MVSRPNRSKAPCLRGFACSMPLLLLLAGWQPTAAAQFETDDAPQLNERAITQILLRSEKLLRAGQYLQALRVSGPADQALLSEHTFGFDSWRELSDRSHSLGWICVVRLDGAYTITRERAKDKHAALVQAEARLRDLLSRKTPIFDARYGEALAALDRMSDAYALLAPLYEREAIQEPESHAALARAAAALGHAEIAAAAHASCRKLAGARAKRTCPARRARLPDRAHGRDQ
jgi:hypothetical protein